MTPTTFVRISFAALLTGLLACTVLEDLGGHARAKGDGGASGTTGSGGTSGFVCGKSLPTGSTEPSSHAGKYVFVTEGVYTGDLKSQGGGSDGLTGADAICMKEAKDAGVGGTFRAWLSTSTECARERMAAVGPWTLVNGEVVFPGKEAGGDPDFPIRIDAKGHEYVFGDEQPVWTSTDHNGAPDSTTDTCRDWTSSSVADRATHGIANSLFWSDTVGDPKYLSCDHKARLYCFEQ